MRIGKPRLAVLPLSFRSSILVSFGLTAGKPGACRSGRRGFSRRCSGGCFVMALPVIKIAVTGRLGSVVIVAQTANASSVSHSHILPNYVPMADANYWRPGPNCGFWNHLGYEKNCELPGICSPGADGDATEAALVADPAFDLCRALPALFLDGAIIAVSLAQRRSGSDTRQ